MKLTGLHLENWLCHRRLDVTVTPLTLCCGPNARGKSSLADGIAFALLAELRRVKLKGDRKKLITRGADRGSVRVTFPDVEIARDIESGKLTKPGKMPTAADSVELLPNCLDISLFARMDIDARRVALLRMMDVRIDTPAIHAELVARQRQVKLMGACFAHGVPIEKWHEEATKKLTEARGAWKQITGETYGPKKAEDWKAPAPEQAFSLEYHEAAKARVAQAEVEIGLLQRTLGRLEQLDSGSSPNLVARRQSLEAQAAPGEAARAALEKRRLEANELRAQLDDADASLADVRRRQPGADPLLCPHCGEGVVHRDGALEPHVAPDDPATPAELAIAERRRAELALRLQGARASITTGEVDVERAETARAALALLDAGSGITLEAEPEALPSRATIEAGIEAQTAARNAAQAEISALERARDTAAAAERTTKTAADKHGQIAAWTLIVEDLSPAGILQTLIGKALDPLNDMLRDLSARFRWPQPRVGQDMEVAIDGTEYGLHSESEQWRADALLTVAIAALTKLRIAVLDRFDVLEIPARQAALAAFYGLTKPGGPLDTCILLATLKAPPTAPADVSLIWLGEPAAVQVAA